MFRRTNDNGSSITLKEDSLQQNDKEPEAAKDKDTVMEERASEEYKNHDMTKPQRGIDPTRVMKTILGMKDHPR